MEVINAIGRRKEAVARLLLTKGKGAITINDKDYRNYFKINTLHALVESPLTILDLKDKFDIRIIAEGGGFKGQAEAVRLAISRALCKISAEYKPALKAQGFMTRDPRKVERKKPGHKKARKSYQFSKR